MAEQTGPSVAAMQARQAALTERHGTVADADRVLAEALAGAHVEMNESVRRLDAIAADIDRAVSEQADTPLGAREFQRFLVAKQREITAVVAHARELARAKAAVLEGLRARYAAVGQA
jgi:predicted component of type VI protein secretion system